MHSSFATDLFFLQLLIFWCCFIDKVPVYVLQDNLEFPVFVTYSSGCFLLLLYPSGMHSSFAGKSFYSSYSSNAVTSHQFPYSKVPSGTKQG
jgi:hypothetical protein